MLSIELTNYITQYECSPSGLSYVGIKIEKYLKMNNNNKQRPKVLFFDVNETLLDLQGLKEKISDVLNGRDDLVSLWFSTLLHYSLVTTASGKYEPFGYIGGATLQMVAANNDIKISKEEARSTVVNALRGLHAHPEAKEALSLLRKAGFTLVSFTNSSNEGVKEQFENAGLTDYFDARLSVADVGKFKPFTDTYTWGARTMGVPPAACMLIAAHGWDIAGALAAGWRAAFVARPGKQLFPLAPEPEINAPDLLKIAQKLIALDA